MGKPLNYKFQATVVHSPPPQQHLKMSYAAAAKAPKPQQQQPQQPSQAQPPLPQTQAPPEPLPQEPYFQLYGVGLDAQSLQSAASQLYEKVQRLPVDLRQAYRLEVIPRSTNSWEMEMLLDALRWFELRKDSVDASALTALEDRANALIESHSDDYCTNDPSPFPTPTYCPYGPTCDYYLKRKEGRKCKYEKHVDVCDVNQQRTDRTEKSCGFIVRKELVVREFAQLPPNSPFVLVLRQEGVRDLLLMPNVPCVNRGLHSNAQLVSAPELWAAAVDVHSKLQKELPEIGQVVERLALDFGRWDTGVSKDERALNCHGHLHITLTRAAADALIAKHSAKNKYLIGCVRRPRDLHVRDYRSLVTTHVGNLRLKQLDKKITDGFTELKHFVTLGTVMSFVVPKAVPSIGTHVTTPIAITSMGPLVTTPISGNSN